MPGTIEHLNRDAGSDPTRQLSALLEAADGLGELVARQPIQQIDDAILQPPARQAGNHLQDP
jgi:hypothetical protein